LVYIRIQLKCVVMAYPQSLRTKIGVSQAVFANLIGCSETALSMAEIGQRQLPTASLAIVLLLEQTLVQVTAQQPQTAAPTIDKKKLTRLLAKVQLQLINKQQKLTKLNDQIKKCLQLQQMQLILGDAAFQKASVTELQWAILQRKATKSFQKATEAGVLLQINIAALQAQIAAIEKFI